MLADYFILRKTRLDVPKLYDNHTYRYAGGFSPVGMLSLVAGALVSFMFLDYSWLVGFPFTLAFFLIVKKLGLDARFDEVGRGRVE